MAVISYVYVLLDLPAIVRMALFVEWQLCR